MSRAWPTEDVQSDNNLLAPSKLKSGLKRRNQVLQTDSNDDETPVVSQSKKKKKSGRPVEMSAYVKPSNKKLLKEMELTLPRQLKTIDPRFVSYTGDINQAAYEKNYEFISDVREQYITDLKKNLKRASTHQEKDELKRELQSEVEKMRHIKSKRDKTRLKTEFNQKQKELAEQGVTPRFYNHQVEREIGLAKQFLSMSQREVEKKLKNRRERRTQKEKKVIGDAM